MDGFGSDEILSQALDLYEEKETIFLKCHRKMKVFSCLLVVIKFIEKRDLNIKQTL